MHTHTTTDIIRDYHNTLRNQNLELEARKGVEKEPAIQKAIADATRFHQGQYRKIDKTPYIAHPLAVAKILSRFTQNLAIIQAGLLHDVIEDVEGGKETLQHHYSPEIIDLITSVSEQDKSLSRQQRKETYLHHLLSASYPTLLISLADRIHNLRSMLPFLEKQGEQIREFFNAGVDKQNWFLHAYSHTVQQAIKHLTNDQEKSDLEELLKELNQLIADFLYLQEHTLK